MALPTFDLGDRVRLGNWTESGLDAFTDIEGVVNDPDAVLLTLKLPDGTRRRYGWPDPWPGMTEGDESVVAEVDGVLTREAAGRVYWDVTVRQSGRWHVRLASTGDPETAEEFAFYVRASRVLA